MRRQKGMTMIGWLGTISILLVLVLAGIRLLPVYLQYFRINDVMLDIPLQMQKESKVTPRTIESYISKRFDIEAVNIIGPRDVTISRDGEMYLVVADYEHKVPYLGNVSFAVDFRKEVRVPR